MKKLRPMTAGAVPVLATNASWAQSGNMMNGGMWDGGWMTGYGGIWGPVLLVVAVGLVVWVVMQRRK